MCICSELLFKISGGVTDISKLSDCKAGLNNFLKLRLKSTWRGVYYA